MRERFTWKQALALGLSAALVAAAPSLLRSAEECGCSTRETRQWTFDFDPEAGLQVFHHGKELGAVDPAKVDLNGFTAVAVWGDGHHGPMVGGGREQNIWVSNVTATLGGPVKVLATGGQYDPYDDKAVAADAAASRPVTLYTKDKPPPSPKLDDLPLVSSVSQYGITWTFERPARAGRFVNGDWYVVGPVTVKAIDPQPLYGSQIPKFQLDHDGQGAAGSRRGFATDSWSIRRPG